MAWLLASATTVRFGSASQPRQVSAFGSLAACPEWRKLGWEADVDRITGPSIVGDMTLRKILFAILLMTSSAVVAGPTTKPAKLEGMKYDEARLVIMGFGWTPFPSECGGPPVDEGTCARYPELGYCQGNGRGFCSMAFAKPDRCLLLTTVESPPGQGGYTVILDVGFHRGSCLIAPK